MNVTIEELAANYTRYWNRENTGQWSIADNAPNPFWKFVLRHNHDRQMLHAALVSIATTRPPEAPSLIKVLEWFAANPKFISLFDDALGTYRTPPKSFEAVAAKAYKKVIFQVISDLHEFLSHQSNNI